MLSILGSTQWPIRNYQRRAERRRVPRNAHADSEQHGTGMMAHAKQKTPMAQVGWDGRTANR